MRCFILSFLCIIICYARPVAAAESFISPAIAENETADSIGPSIERRNALGYDPTRHSLFPDFYYRYRAWHEKINKKLGLETLLSYDTLFQLYADRDWAWGHLPETQPSAAAG
jgi:hypothetical protein